MKVIEDGKYMINTTSCTELGQIYMEVFLTQKSSHLVRSTVYIQRKIR